MGTISNKVPGALATEQDEAVAHVNLLRRERPNGLVDPGAGVLTATGVTGSEPAPTTTASELATDVNASAVQQSNPAPTTNASQPIADVSASAVQQSAKDPVGPPPCGDDPILPGNTQKIFDNNEKISVVGSDSAFIGGDSLTNVFQQTREQAVKSETSHKNEMDQREKHIKEARAKADKEIREKTNKGDRLLEIRSRKEQVSKTVPIEQEKNSKN